MDIKNDMTKSNLGMKGFIFAYISTSQSITEENSSRNQKEGSDAEAMEKCYLLACSSWL